MTSPVGLDILNNQGIKFGAKDFRYDMPCPFYVLLKASTYNVNVYLFMPFEPLRDDF